MFLSRGGGRTAGFVSGRIREIRAAQPHVENEYKNPYRLARPRNASCSSFAGTSRRAIPPRPGSSKIASYCARAVLKRQLRNGCGFGPPKIFCPNIVKVKYAGVPVKASNGRHFSDGIDGRHHVDVDEFDELDDNDIAALLPG